MQASGLLPWDTCAQVKVSEYNTLKSQLSAVARKQTGSLSVRDISTLVKPEHLVDSENLTTLFVVVTKFGMDEWRQTYEKLTNHVVGSSALGIGLFEMRKP